MSGDEFERLRSQIGDTDREILAAVNRRLELVARLKSYKEAHGIPFVDLEREAALIEERLRENVGPLSAAGVRAFYAELLALTKREVYSSSSPGSSSGSTSASAKSSAET
jgi:chorismate mutase